MLFEPLPRKIKRRAAALQILRRQLELAMGATVAGTAAGWLLVIRGYPKLATGVISGAFVLFGGIVVGLLLRLRRSPPADWVERIARKLGPQAKRRQLTRTGVAVVSLAAGVFAYGVGAWKLGDSARTTTAGETSATTGPQPVPSATASASLGPPQTLELPPAEPITQPVTIRFGWKPGMRLRAAQVVTDTRENPGKVTETLTGRLSFVVVTQAHPDGLEVALTEITETPIEGGSLRGRADYLRDVAVTKALPAFVVDTEGQFVRIVDPDAAIERARQAVQQHPVAMGFRSAIDPDQIDEGWLAFRARQLWKGWSQGVVQKSPLRDDIDEPVKMPVPMLGTSVDARQSWRVVGKTACPGGTSCVVVEHLVKPDTQALKALTEDSLSRTGSMARLKTFDQAIHGYLVMDERSIVHEYATLVITTSSVVMPGGLQRTQRRSKHTRVVFQ